MAPLPLGKLAHGAPSPSGSPCVFVSLPFLLLVLTFQACGGGVCVGGCCGVGGCHSGHKCPPPTQRGVPYEKVFGSSHHSVCSLFVLFAYHRCAAAALASMIACQSASSSAWEWVSQVSWLSDVLSRDQQKRRHLPVMCQVLSRQTDANESGKCVTFRYALPLSCASVSPLTNTDWQNILSVFEYGCRRLTTVWDVNEELVNSQHLFLLLSEYKSLSERTAKQLQRDIMIYELWLYCQL